MKLFLQILIILFTCFTSSALPIAIGTAPNIVVLTNTSPFQQYEQVSHSEKAKIGIEIPKAFGIARSSIEEQQTQTTTFHQNTFLLSSYLKEENSCVLDFQKTNSPYQVKVAQNSKKERFSELENREREVLDVFVNGTGKLLVISELKAITGVMPTGNKLTNLSFSKFFKGFDADFVASLGSKYVDDLAKIKQGLDKGGDLTEGIVSEALRKQGYTVTKDLGKYGSNNGFDVVAIKGSPSNPTEIRIIESKPMNSGSVNLSVTVNKGTQMSDFWIDQTIEAMINSSNQNLIDLGTNLLLNRDKITKLISTVNKDTREIIIIKLDAFNG